MCILQDKLEVYLILKLWLNKISDRIKTTVASVIAEYAHNFLNMFVY